MSKIKVSALKRKSVPAAIVFLLLAAACSRLNMAVDYAPRYITNGLEDALDFNSDRYDRIKTTVENDIRTNKGALIAEAVSLVEDLQRTAAQPAGLDLKAADTHFKKIKELQAKAVALFRPSFREVIMGLTSGELAHLQKFSDKKFAKIDERLLDREEFVRYSFKSFERTMNILFDSVTEQQKTIYRDFLNANYDYYKGQIETRKSFLQEFSKLLADKPALLEYTMKYYAGDDGVKSPEQLKRQSRFFANLNQLQVDIWNSTSAEQREELKKTLASIKEELKELAN